MRPARVLGTAAAAGCLVFAQPRAVQAVPAASLRGSPTTRVTAGHARFEFLTPSLVRMEYSPAGTFIDAATAVVEKRDWATVKVTMARAGGWVTIESSALTLRYRPAAGAFGADDLSVSWRDPAGGTHLWRPGQADPGNLGGLTYSLDNISAATLPPPGDDLGSPIHDIIPGIDVLLQPATPGLLSKSGYALLDDSASPVWNADHSWIEPRPGPAGQDWYLFAYDRDYTQPLKEYAELCGAVPMVPRYVLGPWITDLNFEYFPGTAESRSPAMRRYGEQHLQGEVARLLASDIPLSGLVLDFAWHDYGWQGGYDWSPLIPHSQALIDWLHARGVKLSLNDHPGYANTEESSLSYSDSHAPEVLKALGEPMPAAPSYDQTLAGVWRFSPDPHDAGLKAHWFATDYDDARWRAIHTDEPWQAQGYPDYEGVGWYRAAFRLPAKLPRALYLYLGEVSGAYRLFVNGQEVQHSHVQWPRRLTYADLTQALRAGQRNVIALRVEPPAPSAPEAPAGILRGPVALRDVLPPPRIYLNLADRKQARISMSDLHEPLVRQGMDFWWVDGGGGAAQMQGLDPQLWTNEVFYDATKRQTGKRAFILSRYGGWGSERYPGFFTGDTYSEWRVLAYEVAYTARGGNVLVPYISNDIGGFHGAKIPFDLYARWIEFGTFSPILRMHSAHENPLEGNTRMPWLYGPKGVALMRKYFTLRTQLIPYLYTYCWQAHERSLPLLRPLYLEWPDLDQAYRHFHEYYFGDEMLVAPVLAADGQRTVYLPPGSWMDFFTGKRYQGNTTFTARYAVDATPVFVREGSIIPEQSGARDGAGSILTVNVYGAGKGRFDLYEDDGTSLAYEQGWYAQTPMTYTTDGGSHRLVIGPTSGSFSGQADARGYEIRIHTARRPTAITVDGRRAPSWRWEARDSTAILMLPVESIRRTLTVTW